MRISKKTVRMRLAVLAGLLTVVLGSSVCVAGTVNVPALKNKGVVISQGQYVKGDQYCYHKITVPRDGYIMVTGLEKSIRTGSEFSVYGVLCNSKMQVIDYNTTNSLNKNRVTDNYGFQSYAVKKGVYYFRDNQNMSGYEHYLQIYYETGNMKGGQSKKKAFNLKKGKTYSAMIAAGSGSASSRWFKIKANGKKRIKLTVDFHGQGYFKLLAKGKKLNSSMTLDPNETSEYELYSRKGYSSAHIALSKGTYYLRLKRKSGYPKSNGYFTIKWSYYN